MMKRVYLSHQAYMIICFCFLFFPSVRMHYCERLRHTHAHIQRAGTLAVRPCSRHSCKSSLSLDMGARGLPWTQVGAKEGKANWLSISIVLWVPFLSWLMHFFFQVSIRQKLWWGQRIRDCIAAIGGCHNNRKTRVFALPWHSREVTPKVASTMRGRDLLGVDHHWVRLKKKQYLTTGALGSQLKQTMKITQLKGPVCNSWRLWRSDLKWLHFR